MTKTKWIIGGIAALVIILAACAAPYFFIGAPAEGIVKVRKGSTIDMISDSVQANVDATFGKRVATMMKLMGAKVENREGAFRIKSGMSPFTAARRIKNGVQDGIRFTFNNVRTLDEWTQRWGDTFMDGPDNMRKALKDSTICAKYGKTPETIACLLMPDTYEFYWNTDAEGFVIRMFQEYNKFWTEERKQQAQAKGLTPIQVSTLASIVNKETNMTDEMPRVAGVYLNRLKNNWLLQADPTLIFAWNDYSIRRVLDRHKEIESPYNTYKYIGLPPGPICIPSIAAVKAVLNAEDHHYFYFCAKEDFSGYHNFAKTLSEHNRNTVRYQQALNQRGIMK